MHWGVRVRRQCPGTPPTPWPRIGGSRWFLRTLRWEVTGETVPTLEVELGWTTVLNALHECSLGNGCVPAVMSVRRHPSPPPPFPPSGNKSQPSSTTHAGTPFRFRLPGHWRLGRGRPSPGTGMARASLWCNVFHAAAATCERVWGGGCGSVRVVGGARGGGGVGSGPQAIEDRGGRPTPPSPSPSGRCREQAPGCA